jgi:hypothetical protein
MSPICVCTFIILRRRYKRASVAARRIISRIRKATGARRRVASEAGGQVSWGFR